MDNSKARWPLTAPRFDNTLKIFCTIRSADSIANSRTYLIRLKVLNGKFCQDFAKIEAELEKPGEGNPLEELYRKSEATGLAEAEMRVRARLALHKAA